MKVEIIDRCESTNAAIDRQAPHGYALMALEQTAGRGQRGNSWEAEPGRNITLSLMVRPEAIPVADQFRVSEAASLGILDLLCGLGLQDVSVKWPNDIYVGDRKICGILIENSLSGNFLARSIIGIGLNVNQTRFLSDAPNPVSIAQLTGRTYALQPLAEQMVSNILSRLDAADNHADYLRNLWRREGEHPWQTPDGQRFSASIVDVLPSGHLQLSNRPTPYAFKEVAPIL